MTLAERYRKKGKEEGKVEGKTEGKEEAKLEVAKNLIKLQYAKNDIIKATGLTEEQIDKL